MTTNQVTFRDGPLVTATIDARQLQRHVDIKELQRVISQQVSHMSRESRQGKNNQSADERKSPMSENLQLNTPGHHDLLRLANILQSMVQECVAIELPGGCTLETVPKIHMDAAREWFGVAEPTPQKLTEIFNLTQEDES